MTYSKRRPASSTALLQRWAGILLILVAPVAIYFATKQYRAHADMANWPQTEGQITDHNVYEVYEIRKRNEVQYAVSTKFRYQVEGKTYSGERAKPGSSEMSAAERDALMARYPVGSRHPVYYAPSDPEWAYLEVGEDSAVLVRFVLAWVMLVAGIVFVALSLAPPERPDSPGARWARLGGWLMGNCLATLLIGGAIVRIFFPENLSKDVLTALLLVQIPIWGAGLLGLLLWIAGRLRG